MDDCGGAFTMGAIGGGIFQAVKGFRNAPSVSSLAYLIEFLNVLPLSIRILVTLQIENQSVQTNKQERCTLLLWPPYHFVNQSISVITEY